jgi:hypothetical protein
VQIGQAIGHVHATSCATDIMRFRKRESRLTSVSNGPSISGNSGANRLWKLRHNYKKMQGTQRLYGSEFEQVGPEILPGLTETDIRLYRSLAVVPMHCQSGKNWLVSSQDAELTAPRLSSVQGGKRLGYSGKLLIYL